MILYHGSMVAVETPQILPSLRKLDFGAGFYTTINKEQAVQWTIEVARRRGSKERVISEYTFDEAAAERELAILRVHEPDEAWLKFVCDCRSGRETFDPYDMAVGLMANDRIFLAIQLYENGAYNMEEAIRRLKIQPLFSQTLFHTEKALSFCRYERHDVVEGTT